MAEKPYKFTDRRGLGAGFTYFGGTGRGFSEAARTSFQRQQYDLYDKDGVALMPSFDRRKLMTVGRALYMNSSVVKSALDQMSRMSTSLIVPQFDGNDKAWGRTAEEWLWENDRWIDVRGWPYNQRSIDRLIILSIIRDGDVGELLTEDEQGNPKIQLIPAHRIGTRNMGNTRVEGGPFDGLRIIDGVILGDSYDIVGYRVLGITADLDTDYSVNDLKLHYLPFFTDQIRGYSWLASAFIDIQDNKEFRRLELIAQKLLASRTVVEHNEAGMADSGLAQIIVDGVEASASQTGDAIKPVYGQTLAGGETTYFRAGSNSKLEIVTGDRPTANQQNFSAETIRQAINSIGWSVDYALDPTKAGGANMRIVVETINDTIDSIRRDLLVPIRRWTDSWRVAKAIKNGFIKYSDEWYKWEYQFAQRKTADKKYDSDVDINEFRAGFQTLRDVCAKRGEWYQDVLAQKERELDEQMQAAQRISEKYGITMESALDRLGLIIPNGTPAGSVTTDPISA